MITTWIECAAAENFLNIDVKICIKILGPSRFLKAVVILLTDAFVAACRELLRWECASPDSSMAGAFDARASY